MSDDDPKVPAVATVANVKVPVESADPLKDVVHIASPVIDMFLGVARLEAVVAVAAVVAVVAEPTVSVD